MRFAILLLLILSYSSVAVAEPYIIYLNGGSAATKKGALSGGVIFAKLLKDSGLVVSREHLRGFPIVQGVYGTVPSVYCQRLLAESAFPYGVISDYDPSMSSDYLKKLGGMYPYYAGYPECYIAVPTAVNLANELKPLLTEGVVLVGHSQGNAYMEAAISILKNEGFDISRVKTVGMASMVVTAHLGDYVNLNLDRALYADPYYLLWGGRQNPYSDELCFYPCDSIATYEEAFNKTQDEKIHNLTTYLSTDHFSFSKKRNLPSIVISYVKNAFYELDPTKNNLLLGSTVTDSCPSTSCPYNTHGNPNNLTDGNTESGRNLGTYSGSFNVFLSNPVNLARLTLTPAMTPNGTVYYEIQTSTDPTGAIGTWTSHGQKSSTWVNLQNIEIPLNANTTGVRVVKVIVSSSPSWVALHEVQGFAQ